MIFSKGRSHSFSLPKFAACLSVIFWLSLATVPGRADDASVSTDVTPSAASSSPPSSDEPAKVPAGGESPKTLVIHKPRPSPAWGRVIQYHREEVLPLSDKNREILHEFLFQDDQGIVRTAIFHENASGDGYWEVYVWDQP